MTAFCPYCHRDFPIKQEELVRVGDKTIARCPRCETNVTIRCMEQANG